MNYKEVKTKTWSPSTGWWHPADRSILSHSGGRKRWSDTGFILKSTANTLAGEFSVENERIGLKAMGRLVELTEECGRPELSLLEEQDRRRLGAQF